MDHVQAQRAPAGMSLAGAFWFHVAAAIGLLPAMIGFDRRARRPAPAARSRSRLARPARGRGNLVEAAMLAIAAAEKREARKATAACSGQGDQPRSH